MRLGGFEGILDGGIEDEDGPVVLFRVEHSEEEEAAGREGGGAVPLPEEDFFAMEFCQDFQNLDCWKVTVWREETGGFGEDLVAAAAEAVGGRVDVVDVVDTRDGKDLDGMCLFVLEEVSLNVAVAKELAVAFVFGFMDAAELRREERIELRAQGWLSREELTIEPVAGGQQESDCAEQGLFDGEAG